MKQLFLVLALSVSTLPAQADISDCDATLRAAGYPIDGVSGNGPSDTKLRVDCATCTPAQSAQALKLAQDPNSWVLRRPDVPGLVLAVRTDATFTPQVRIGLGGLLGLLLADCWSAPAAQQDWNDSVATYGNSWLTSTVQQTLLKYFAQFNIPIHAGP